VVVNWIFSWDLGFWKPIVRLIFFGVWVGLVVQVAGGEGFFVGYWCFFFFFFFDVFADYVGLRVRCVCMLIAFLDCLVRILSGFVC